MNTFRMAGLVVAAACLSGCGLRPGDGTQGYLRSGEEPLGNIRVSVNRVHDGRVQLVGSGLTDPDGSFRLVTSRSTRGLQLAPGEYRCTLKSVGAQVRIPNVYAHVNSTPLKVSWTAGDKSLDLKVPATAVHQESAAQDTAERTAFRRRPAAGVPGA